MCAWLPLLLRRSARPPVALGVVTAVCLIAVEALLAHLLETIADPASLGVVYLVGVLAVSIVWGLGLGAATAVASALAFDFLNLPPQGTLAVHQGEGLVTLLVFLVVSLTTGSITSVSRALAAEAEKRRREADARRQEADERRCEADLATRLSRVLLGVRDLPEALAAAALHVGRAAGLPGLTLVPGAAEPGPGRVALPLCRGGVALGTLIVGEAEEPVLRHLERRVVPVLVSLLGAACDRAEIHEALKASRDDLHRIVAEQAALRRVATLVARGVTPEELFGAVAAEMGRILDVEHAAIVRYDRDGMLVSVGSWNARGPEFRIPPGWRYSPDVPSVAGMVWRTGRRARMTGFDSACGEIAAWARRRGVRSAVGTPISVDGRVWGVAITLSTDAEPAAGVERRMEEFTELVATAISNAQARTQLAASRARAVTAADDTRRRIERDLHDGAQQRLVAVGLGLRAAREEVPPELPGLGVRLDHVADDVAGVVADLQELSRGLHPAILSRGGLIPAVKMLARRSAVPVELDLRVRGRLDERVEVAVYYVVSEALTNIAKHAHASVVEIGVTVRGRTLRLSVHDDGIGGADPQGGSGLAGLGDRVEVAGGTLTVSSVPGEGTSLEAVIPLHTVPPAAAKAAT
ncbi:sensor histidine kinase [Sphaerisporangium aureirubrum]|uniref:DUF4118 domain-containing protein n=1 Tax=Sphaerisporangium aureirubrum TaxID=1544736 RepID=A0ABW1NKT8_9ACTN